MLSVLKLKSSLNNLLEDTWLKPLKNNILRNKKSGTRYYRVPSFLLLWFSQNQLFCQIDLPAS